MLPVTALAACALIFNALIWGLSWWPLHHMRQHGLHPLWASAMMYGWPLLGMLCWYWRQARASFAQQPWLWALLLAAGLTNACFNWAVTIGDVVRVVLLFYLMPLWAVLLARWLLDEAISAAALWRMVLALLGVVLVMQPASMHWRDWSTWQLPVPHTLADVLALLGGFFFACTNVMLRRTAGSSTAGSRVLAMFAGAVCVSGLVATLGGLLAGPHIVPAPALDQWPDWLPWVLGSGMMFVLANLALGFGSLHLGAHAMSLLMLTEVVFASVSSIAAGAAVPTAHTLPGGALILSAALLAAIAPETRSARGD